MQKLLSHNINKMLLFAVVASFTLFSSHSFAQSHRCSDSKDYIVEFDYKGHQKEREIAYKYFWEKYKRVRDKSHPQKSSIGIVLCDIDHDGNDEIIAYLTDSWFCGSAGCEFEILKPHTNNNEPINIGGWCDSAGKRGSINVREPVMIKKNFTLGFRDIVFEPQATDGALWQWNGKCYNLTKTHADESTHDTKPH